MGLAVNNLVCTLTQRIVRGDSASQLPLATLFIYEKGADSVYLRGSRLSGGNAPAVPELEVTTCPVGWSEGSC